jgi:hypothetical protein
LAAKAIRVRRLGGDGFDVPPDHTVGWVEGEDVVELGTGETVGFYRVLAIVEGDDTLEIQIGEQLAPTPEGTLESAQLQPSVGYPFPPGS